MKIMTLIAKSGDTEITIPAWLWAGVGAVLLLIVGAIGTMVGQTLSTHSDRLLNHESRIAIAETQIAGQAATVMRIDSRIEKIDEKIDRLLELNRK